ncbi:MAG: shikimate dehydrogenase [Actinobacteria bacterium]|nr:shikimate dehydrogenase [Actinomycetota bacterium]
MVAAVIGDPIVHSLSPRIHNAAFRSLGLDWVFVALPVAPGDAAAAVDGARALGIRGMSVTMPHKEAVIPALDDLTPVAAALGAVNCIRRSPREDRSMLGDNTDGVGYLRGLRVDLGIESPGVRAVVLGAGGAGRAVTHALGSGGASSVVVVNRDRRRGEAAAALAGAVGSFVPADDPGAVAAVIGEAELLVNATPVGMGSDTSLDDEGPLPVPAALLRADLAVSELVYHPSVTPLMAAARRRGAMTANGISMLVHQAAVAFEHWTGHPAPIEAMAAAVAR